MKKYLLLCVSFLLFSTFANAEMVNQNNECVTAQLVEENLPASSSFADNSKELDLTLDTNDLSELEQILDDIPLEIIEEQEHNNPQQDLSLSAQFKGFRIFVGMRKDDFFQHIGTHKKIYSLITVGTISVGLAILIWIYR